jgi:hypothetical protein
VVARFPNIMRFYRFRRSIKKYLIELFNRLLGRSERVRKNPELDVKLSATSLGAGDVVRVRSLSEVKATLGSNRRLKGCRFMPEMEQYCNTVQRVYKPLERFLNERDYTIRKSKGLVLLENLYCQGNDETGRCDRSCFYFWRVEWLEKAESTC